MLEHAGTIKFSMTSLFYRTYFRVVDNKSQAVVDFDFFFLCTAAGNCTYLSC